MRERDACAEVARRTGTITLVMCALLAFGTARPVFAFHSLTDVSVGMTASSPSVGPGESITYTITVTNNTPGATTGIISLSDVIPLGTTFVSMSGTFPFAFHVGIPGVGQPCTTPAVGTTGTVTCTGTLNPADFDAADTATFTLVVQVAPDAPSGPITNTASATLLEDTRQRGADPDLSNNSATATVEVQEAPASGPDGVRPGKGCGDKNHVHEREERCKKPPK